MKSFTKLKEINALKNLEKTHCVRSTKKVCSKKKKKYQTLATPRDKRLFVYLFKTRGANIEQINRDLFQASYQVVTRRLMLLRVAGFLERKFYCLPGANRPKAVFFVTKKALYEVGYDDEDLKSAELRSNHPSHEIALGEIRHKFKMLKSYRGYATETELQTQIMTESLQNITKTILDPLENARSMAKPWTTRKNYASLKP